MQKSKFGIGDLLKDRVTGLEGIVMVVAHYATGCVHVGIQSQKLCNDGKRQEWDWIDQSQLDLIQAQKVVFKTDVTAPGGPAPSGPQM